MTNHPWIMKLERFTDKRSRYDKDRIFKSDIRIKISKLSNFTLRWVKDTKQRVDSPKQTTWLG